MSISETNVWGCRIKIKDTEILEEGTNGILVNASDFYHHIPFYRFNIADLRQWY